MAENYSHLQKLCLETIQSGAINAFIEFFRLTHMEQPLGNNQPQSYEDLIGTAGSEAPVLAPLFSFDSPLGMPLNQLQIVQSLLQEADGACLQNDLLTQFKALSAVSDTFLENHKLRLRVKMLPLVTPYPIYSQLLETKQNALLKLIDSPDFQKQVVDQDPLIAAVAKLKKQEIQTQTFPPVVIQYALKARNCVFELIQQKCKDYDPGVLFDLMPDANTPGSPAGSQLPKEIFQECLLLLTSAYLRLAVSLQTFGLCKPAYAVFQLFQATVETLESECSVSRFQPNDSNGYKRVLNDEHINMQSDKKDDNLAFASMELQQVPKLYETILDRERICCEWALDSTPPPRPSEPNLGALSAFGESHPQLSSVGSKDELLEFIFAGRMAAVMNSIQLACQIYTQQAGSLADIKIDVSELDASLRAKQGLGPREAGGDFEAYTGEVPEGVKCGYTEFLYAACLLRQALEQSLQHELYSTTLPAFKRFAELMSDAGLYALAEGYSARVRRTSVIFDINGLAWEARWARLQGDEAKRHALLEERLRVAQEAAAGDPGSVKYAVAAASELVFSEAARDVGRMEAAWQSLREAGAGGSVAIEARVRCGAVRGAAALQAVARGPAAAEEGHDEDLDDVVLDA